MNAWLHNTRMNLKLAFRERQTLFWNYVFPLFFLFIFSSVFAHGNPQGVSLMMPGLLCISTMSAGFFGMSIGLVTSRERGILRRYQLSPFKPWMLVSSQIVSAFFIVLSSLCFQFALAKLVYHVEVAGSFPAMLVVMSLGVLAFLSLGYIVASVAENAKSAQVMANMIYFPLMFLGGAAIPLQFLSPTLQKFTKLLPSYYLVEGLRRVMVDGAGLGAVLSILGVLVMTCVTALAIASGLFRWEAQEPLPLKKKAWVAVVVLVFVVAAQF